MGKIRDTVSERERIHSNDSILVTICNMEMVYRHTNCVFNWQLTFEILLALIENSHFHFLLILDRGVISRQTCDNSTFSLHMKILSVSININRFILKKQKDFAKICQFILEIWKVFYEHPSIRNSKSERIVANIWWIHKYLCLVKIFAGPAHFDFC